MALNKQAKKREDVFELICEALYAESDAFKEFSEDDYGQRTEETREKRAVADQCERMDSADSEGITPQVSEDKDTEYYVDEIRKKGTGYNVRCFGAVRLQKEGLSTSSSEN